MAGKNYIGFNSLEKLLEQADKSLSIEAMPIIQPGRADRRFGISICTQMIVVSQFKAQDVLYVRIITGRFQSLDGIHPIDSARERYVARSESAWVIVQNVIKEHGFTIREALAGFPKTLRFLDGHADCLHYNKQTDLYEHNVLAQEELS